MKQEEESEDGEEEDAICFGLIRYRSAPRGPQPLSADNVLERLRKLVRAQYLQIGSYDHDMQEERLLAKMYLERKPPDTDAARTHARLALMHKETRKKEFAKYENLVRLVAQMEEAQRNLGMAQSMVESRDLLQCLTRETDRLNIEEVTDALREYLEQVRDHSASLSEPLLQQDEEEVDEELDHLMELQHPLPNVPIKNKKIKQNERVGIGASNH